MNAAISFYNPEGEFGWLANFSHHSFVLHGYLWPSVEHYFQANKFAEESRVERVRGCRTAIQAKAIAKMMRAYKRPDWCAIRVDVMRGGIDAKFRQNPELLDLLLGTLPRDLIETAPGDDYWGIGPDGQGRNIMGILLMDLRKQLCLERKANSCLPRLI